MKKNKQNTNIVADYAEEVESSILNYSISAIGRAIPDVRDGLKPVHRRILYVMYSERNTFDKPYRKTIKTVGSTLSRFHPHGDSSVYDAMVRLAQDFKMRVPLIDGHGNFGSIDGDGAAASRYTEARLQSSANYLLEDIEKNVVDMVDNFDGLEKEPTVLPARIPQLLINGTTGIAVGIATNIPPHNPGEVIDAFTFFMGKKNPKLEDILEIMPGPDYPTGAIVINKDDMFELYNTGSGKAIIRAKMTVEKTPGKKPSIIITEIPFTYSGNKTKIVELINDLIITKRLHEASEAYDESSKEGIRINIVLKKDYSDAEIKNIFNKLFKLTPLQSNDNYNFMLTNNYQPKQYNLLEYFKEVLDFQRELVKRKYVFLLNKYKSRQEVLEGLVQAINVIDVVIEVARYSKNSKAIKNCLMKGDVSEINFKTKTLSTKAKKFSFTEKQAIAIMAIKLEQLSGLEIDALNKEYLKNQKLIEQAEAIAKSVKEQDKEIKKNLGDIRKNLDTPRLTKIRNEKIVDFQEEKEVEQLVLLKDKFGYLKLVSKVIFDKTPAIEELSLNTNSEDKLVIFMSDGNSYSFKIEELQKMKTPSPRGILIEQLLEQKDANGDILYITTEHSLSTELLLFISSDCFIKRVPGEEFIASKTVLKATSLNPGQTLTHVIPVGEKGKVTFKLNNKKESSKNIKDVSKYKRNSRGIIGVKLGKAKLEDIKITGVN